MTQVPRRLLAGIRPTTRTIDSLLIEEQEFEPTTRGYSRFSYSVSAPPDEDRQNNDVETEGTVTRNRPIIKWNATCIQSLIYPFAIILYLLIGALVFMGLESENERQMIEHTTEQKDRLKAFLNQTFNLTENQMQEIFNNFTSLCVNGGMRPVTPTRWDFVPSFMFVTTTITTIGKVIKLKCVCYVCFM